MKPWLCICMFMFEKMHTLSVQFKLELSRAHMHCAHEVACMYTACALALQIVVYDSTTLNYLYRAWACAVIIIMHNWVASVGVANRRGIWKSCSVALMDGVKQAQAQVCNHRFWQFYAFHDSLGLVNLEISRFSVDNDNDDRQTERLLYPLHMRVG